jgi:formimidoylglutamate deiminase
VPDLPGWLAAGVPLSLGSDSQVTRAGPKNCAGSNMASAWRCGGATWRPTPTQPATAQRLWQAHAARRPARGRFCALGLGVGARADLLVVDTQEDALRGLPADHLLDGLVFAAPARPFARVMVAGRWVGAGRAAAADDFAATMRELWGD